MGALSRRCVIAQLAGWDSGDHIHPNDAGNEAIAAAVSVEMLLED